MPGIAKLGHVALVTPSLEESTWFFRDVIGLKEVDREEETVFLRGIRDWEHHTLSLTAGGQSTVDHIAWRTDEPEDVEAFASDLERNGTDVEHLPPGTERGQGAAIRFEIPAGHTFELYHDVDEPHAPKDRRSRLKNRNYDPGNGSPVLPQRIDHANIHGPDVADQHDWLRDRLGFQLNEYILNEDGSVGGGWLSTNSLVHTLAYGQNHNATGPTFHHVAFYLDSLGDLMNAADVVRENGVPVEGGPGKHGITQANFLYVQDPGSNHRIELFNGGYQIFDPAWEPIEWTAEEAAEGLTWFGSTPSRESTHCG